MIFLIMLMLLKNVEIEILNSNECLMIIYSYKHQLLLNDLKMKSEKEHLIL